MLFDFQRCVHFSPKHLLGRILTLVCNADSWFYRKVSRGMGTEGQGHAHVNVTVAQKHEVNNWIRLEK